MNSPPEYLEIHYDAVNFKPDLHHVGTLPFVNSPLYKAKIVRYRLLSNGNDVKRTYEVTIDIKDIHHDYKPGDAIAILPENNVQEVDELIKRLHYENIADVPYSLTILKDTVKKKPIIPPHLPIYGTIRNAFLRHCDIRSVPKKLFLRAILPYAQCDADKELINELCDLKDSQKYNEFIANEGQTLLGVFNSLPSCKPPIERLFEHLPALLPRYYSIASSPLLRHELKFAFAVVELKNHRGVCTGWMEDILTSQNSELSFYFRKPTNFLSIPNASTPLILIGPGTGVAPYVGFLQHRRTSDQIFGSCSLFFGCRYSKQDNIYEQELKDLITCGLLTQLFTAFSREQDKKIYVQDRILKNGRFVADAIVDGDATVCICGDAKNMSKDVENALVKVLMDNKEMGEDSAKEYLVNMKKTNRYQMDIWI